jgi:hypothetical protein
MVAQPLHALIACGVINDIQQCQSRGYLYAVAKAHQNRLLLLHLEPFVHYVKMRNN